MLGRLIGPGDPDPAVAELFKLLADPAIATVAELSGRMGLTNAVLARLSRAHFGFPPKVLLRRTRFLRALLRTHEAERGSWNRVLTESGYFDASHFTRDCQAFLGMSLGEYLATPKPLAEASLRARQQVLGAPVQSLHAETLQERPRCYQ